MLFLTYDKRHTSVKARYIAEDLQIFVNMSINGIVVAWVRCCEMSLKKNYGVGKIARTVAY